MYVERAADGKIIALHSSAKPYAGEQKSSIDDEVLDFLYTNADADTRKLLLSLSDMGIIRLIEDLVDLLIEKNLILFTELPLHAQKRIHERKQIREIMTSQDLMVEKIL